MWKSAPEGKAFFRLIEYNYKENCDVVLDDFTEGRVKHMNKDSLVEQSSRMCLLKDMIDLNAEQINKEIEQIEELEKNDE